MTAKQPQTASSYILLRYVNERSNEAERRSRNDLDGVCVVLAPPGLSVKLRQLKMDKITTRHLYDSLLWFSSEYSTLKLSNVGRNGYSSRKSVILQDEHYNVLWERYT